MTGSNHWNTVFDHNVNKSKQQISGKNITYYRLDTDTFVFFLRKSGRWRMQSEQMVTIPFVKKSALRAGMILRGEMARTLSAIPLFPTVASSHCLM